MDGFVHLHLHSHYSLLDGAIRFDDLVSAAGTMGHGRRRADGPWESLRRVEFHTAAVAAGIKPILGLEAYISPTTRDDRSMAIFKQPRTTCCCWPPTTPAGGIL